MAQNNVTNSYAMMAQRLCSCLCCQAGLAGFDLGRRINPTHLTVLPSLVDYNPKGSYNIHKKVFISLSTRHSIKKARKAASCISQCTRHNAMSFQSENFYLQVAKMCRHLLLF